MNNLAGQAHYLKTRMWLLAVNKIIITTIKLYSFDTHFSGIILRYELELTKE